MTPVTEELIKIARSQERKLTARERRQCVVYLMSTQPDITNVEMADIFQVTERTIRQDKMVFRKEKAKFIKEDDVGLIIADIALDYERQIRDIENSKSKAKPGTAVYLQHCTAAMELRLRMVKALQDLGYYPKNLGNMTVEKFEFKTIVGKDGAVRTLPVTFVDEIEAIEPEAIDKNRFLTDGKQAENKGISTEIGSSDVTKQN